MRRRGWRESAGNKARFRQGMGGSYSNCPFVCAFGVSLGATSRNISESKEFQAPARIWLSLFKNSGRV